MIGRWTTALAASCTLLLSAAHAGAAETLRPTPGDPRIRTVDYDPQQVVRIVGILRTATQIRFAADETVQHVALGDSAAWEVAPEGNVVFLKPSVARAPTNLIVTTRTPAGDLRHYAFDLTTRSGRAPRGASGAAFVVQFRYPRDERRRLEAALDAEAQALEARILQLKLERGVLQGPRNLAYALQGSADISPSEVTDNGRFTVLRFPGAQAIPAIYSVAEDGSEALVPFDVRGEFLVVHQTARQLRLRRGRAVVCIFNLAFDRYGKGAPSATAAQDVERTLRPEVKP